MSAMNEKSPKHCAKKQGAINKKHLCIYLSTFLLTIFSLIILLSFILHPKTPHFSLNHAEIHHLNTTPPSFLNSSIDITLQSTNPNNNLAIYYDHLQLSAFYHGRIITPQASLLPFHQDRQETVLLSASLAGYPHPVQMALAHYDDYYNGVVKLDFELCGRLKWKVGYWVLRKYTFSVVCTSGVPFGSMVLPSKQGGNVCSTSLITG